MKIKRLEPGYKHPNGITGYVWGLYDDDRLVVTAVTREELEMLAEGLLKIQLEK